MILHAPNHWVTVAATEGEVIYVDSLRSRQQISPYVTRQPLQFFPQHIGGDGKLTMSVVPSMPQTNGEDCGVFAAAYATELLFGDGRRGLQAAFDVPAMRRHPAMPMMPITDTNAVNRILICGNIRDFELYGF